MDGVAGLTQPEVAPNGQFRYQFSLNDAGTYWYTATQRPVQVAGSLRPLIVEDESDPAVDHDIVLMIDDWLLANDATIDEASLDPCTTGPMVGGLATGSPSTGSRAPL